uniref:Uncharacterized protein n=1 Tax=Rhodnius prolixus TaxID=13249 RepID=T1HH95_RHOPR
MAALAPSHPLTICSILTLCVVVDKDFLTKSLTLNLD